MRCGGRRRANRYTCVVGPTTTRRPPLSCWAAGCGEEMWAYPTELLRVLPLLAPPAGRMRAVLCCTPVDVDTRVMWRGRVVVMVIRIDRLCGAWLATHQSKGKRLRLAGSATFLCHLVAMLPYLTILHTPYLVLCGSDVDGLIHGELGHATHACLSWVVN
jgi:hypothetical protein